MRKIVYVASGIITTALAFFASKHLATYNKESLQPVYSLVGDFSTGPKQGIVTREWTNRPWQRAWQIELGNFRGPFSLRADESGRGGVFVLDFSSLSVVHISSDGRAKILYLTPVALKSLTDVEVINGEVWVADNTAKSVFCFSLRGDFVRRIRFSNGAFRLAAVKDGVVTMLPFPSSSPFEIFGVNYKSKGKFGRILEAQDRTLMALDGWIRGRGNTLYFVMEYTGAIAAYSMPDQRPKYFISGVDGGGLPRIMFEKQGKVWVDREAQERVRNISIAGDSLYLIAVARERLRLRGVIDRYRVADGAYLGSQHLPEPADDAVAAENQLFLIRGVELVKWESPSG